jgi:Putative collagen-binding domain of a collagenase
MAYLGGDKSAISRSAELFGSKPSVSIRMDKLTAGRRVNASWIDPRTGHSVEVGHFANTGVQSFSPPDAWADALLILEASAD